MTSDSKYRIWLWLGLVGWLGLCLGSAAFGGKFMMGDWVAALKKPSWNPPGWVFGPVWTVLYTLMAVAAWRVWRRGGWRGQWRALLPFQVQLILSVLYTPLYLGWYRPGLPFFEIIYLSGAIAWTILAFRPVDRWASGLLWPSLAWVIFAAVLNGELWWLNR